MSSFFLDESINNFCCLLYILMTYENIKLRAFVLYPTGIWQLAYKASIACKTDMTTMNLAKLQTFLVSGIGLVRQDMSGKF